MIRRTGNESPRTSHRQIAVPTPEEISRECARIRSGWSSEERRQRQRTHRVDASEPEQGAHLQFIRFLIDRATIGEN